MKVIIGVIFLVFVIIFSLQQIEKDRASFYNSLNGGIVDSNSTIEANQAITIKISGCVGKPGSYSVIKGSFLEDVIAQAGGITEEADMECFEFYLSLEESMEIYIPKTTDDKKTSINDATIDELKKLSGIGTTIATRWVEYRTENGPFQYLEEIMKVNGIGKTIFNNIKDKICL